MMSDPHRKVLALLACLSILISPAYGGDTSREERLAKLEEERARALLIAIGTALEKKKPTQYASNE